MSAGGTVWERRHAEGAFTILDSGPPLVGWLGVPRARRRPQTAKPYAEHPTGIRALRSVSTIEGAEQIETASRLGFLLGSCSFQLGRLHPAGYSGHWPEASSGSTETSRPELRRGSEIAGNRRGQPASRFARHVGDPDRLGDYAQDGHGEHQEGRGDRSERVDDHDRHVGDRHGRRGEDSTPLGEAHQQASKASASKTPMAWHRGGLADLPEKTLPTIYGAPSVLLQQKLDYATPNHRHGCAIETRLPSAFISLCNVRRPSRPSRCELPTHSSIELRHQLAHLRLQLLDRFLTDRGLVLGVHLQTPLPGLEKRLYPALDLGLLEIVLPTGGHEFLLVVYGRPQGFRGSSGGVPVTPISRSW